MGLINGKDDMKAAFHRTWSTYVQAIIAYAENSSRKSVSNLIRQMDVTGNVIKHFKTSDNVHQ